MFRVLADFNEVRDGRVRGLLRDVEGPGTVGPGDRAIVHDGGDEEALGTIERVENDLVYAEVDWSTFGPAGHLQRRLDPTGAWLVTTSESTLMQAGQANLLCVIGVRGDAEVHDEDENSAASPAIA